MEALRTAMMPKHMVDAVASLRRNGSTSEPDFSRWFMQGLRKSPFALIPPRCVDESFAWVLQPSGDNIEGVVYTDGSLLDGDVEFE